jgi:colanic acid/amylovoran biosynthesis glycosyltransferase
LPVSFTAEPSGASALSQISLLFLDRIDMRIAYFSNQYPGVTHTFIRREIRALESLGLEIVRYALRPGKDLVDVDDRIEVKRTRYILSAGIGEILSCCVLMLLVETVNVAMAIRDAISMGWHSDRGILRHLAYIVEAAILARWCRRDGVQHLHAHFGTNSAAIAMLASRMARIPYSFTAHGPDEFERATLLSLDVKLERSSFAVCVSSFGRSQLMRWSHPVQWGKIAVVHCGVDSAFLRNPEQLPPHAPRLVCIGRLCEQKAQVVLVAAARKLHEAGIDLEVVLAGDGPMRSDVEKAIQCAGMQGKISILGWANSEQVKMELAGARALVLASFAENMPVVIMEALAMGRPVISTYVAGIPELVQPGKTGWLVPAGDEIALAEAMREALTASVERLAEMGAAGRLHILEHHDALKEAVKLKGLFERDFRVKSELQDLSITNASFRESGSMHNSFIL